MNRGGNEKIKTRAKIIHKLTKKMRPLMHKELEELNLSPDNTTLELSDSMQVEVNNYLKSHLLSVSPDENTLNRLTDEVYQIAQERHKLNNSVGHILIGVPPKRVPLLEGTVYVGNGNLGKFNLRYRPKDEQAETHEMNGTIKLHDMQLNITHRNAAAKLLRHILTLRPRDLTYSQAENALSRIFVSKAKAKNFKPNVLMTKNTVSTTTLPLTTLKNANEVFTSGQREWKSGVVTKDIPVFTTPIQEQTSRSQYDSNLAKEDILSSLASSVTTLAPTATSRAKTTLPVTTTATTATPRATTPTYLITILSSISTSTSTTITKPNFPTTSPTYPTITTTTTTPTTNAVEILSTQTYLVEEINKLRETITVSRNISSILMEEMELRQRESDKLTNESGRNKSEDKMGSIANWKLQQHTRDLKPDRTYPTMPPFVRKWPTFRPHIRTVTLSEASEPDNCLTFLTMRPKYKGPRHEPFFFDDFKRIKTIYPSTFTTGQVLFTTVLPTENSKMENETLLDAWKISSDTPKADSVQNTDDIKSLVDKTLHADNIPHLAMAEIIKDSLETSIGSKYKNEPPSNTYPSFNGKDESKPSPEIENAKNTDESLKEKYFNKIKPFLEDENSKRTEFIYSKHTTTTSRKPYFATINISGRVHTIKPIFIRSTKFPTTTHSPSIRITTTKKTHFQVIKHHVKTGLNKLFSFFGFGKSKKE